MPIIIIDKDRAVLDIVPDGYQIDGERVSTPGGSSWTVPGAVAHESVSRAVADDIVSAYADYAAKKAERDEVRAAKRITVTAAQGAALDATDIAEIELLLGDEPSAPALYLSAGGDVTDAKPRSDTPVEKYR